MRAPLRRMGCEIVLSFKSLTSAVYDTKLNTRGNHGAYTLEHHSSVPINLSDTRAMREPSYIHW